MFKIESLLSARLFLQPQTAGDHIYFLSNLSGHLSLYKMKIGGSVPQPLLPPDIALQNPHLIDGYSFAIFPKLKKILVMIDKDGDENYQPMFISIRGGYPEEILGGYFKSYRCHLGNFDAKQNIFYLANEEKKKPESAIFQVDLNKNSVIELFRSSGFAMAVCSTENHQKIAIIEAFTVGDEILYLWESGKSEKIILIGTPISDRKPDEKIQLTGINGASFTNDENGILISSAIYSDTYSVGYLDLNNKKELKRVKIKGLIHSGKGELEGISGLRKINIRYPITLTGLRGYIRLPGKKTKNYSRLSVPFAEVNPWKKGHLSHLLIIQRRINTRSPSHLRIFPPRSSWWMLKLKRGTIFKPTRKFLESQTIFFQRVKTLPSNPMMDCECLPGFIYLVKIWDSRDPDLLYIMSMEVHRVRNARILPGSLCR